MKTLVISITAILILAVLGTAALAVDFVCTRQKIGDQFTYTLKNNSTTVDIVEWRLAWDANDALNAPLAAANFTRADASYISTPAQWFRSDDPTEPRWWTDDLVYGGAPIMKNGGQKSYTIVYKTSSSLEASLFKVGWATSGGGFVWSSAMTVDGVPPIPEPGTIAVVLSGLAGAGLLFRRRRS